MRNARSNARATSRCEIQRTLPRFVYRSRTGNPASPLIGTDSDRRSACPRKLTGHVAPPRASRSWPVPWLPPAGGTGDATTCSRA